MTLVSVRLIRNGRKWTSTEEVHDLDDGLELTAIRNRLAKRASVPAGECRLELWETGPRPKKLAKLGKD